MDETLEMQEGNRLGAMSLLDYQTPRECAIRLATRAGDTFSSSSQGTYLRTDQMLQHKMGINTCRGLKPYTVWCQVIADRGAEHREARSRGGARREQGRGHQDWKPTGRRSRPHTYDTVAPRRVGDCGGSGVSHPNA